MTTATPIRVFIVHAHHEPTSFNAAMTQRAKATLEADGHEVQISDLYAMAFNPVSDRRNFITIANPDRLSQQAEETFASANDGYAAPLQQEMDKLAWCDVLIFQFPIWWLGMPAILKGWVDRTFAVGRAYGGGKYFEQGRFAGKRAMISLTVAGPREVYSESGFYAPINDLLFPIHRGIFGFTGFSVVEPYVVYAPSRMSADERAAALDGYATRLRQLRDAPLIPMPNTADYDGFRRIASPGAAAS